MAKENREARSVLAEKQLQDIKSGLERLRNAIRSTVVPRDQNKFLVVIDQIQEMVLHSNVQLDTIQGQIQRTRGTTRRHLRGRPTDMIRLLNSLDGIEKDVVDFFNQVLHLK